MIWKFMEGSLYVIKGAIELAGRISVNVIGKLFELLS